MALICGMLAMMGTAPALAQQTFEDGTSTLSIGIGTAHDYYRGYDRYGGIALKGMWDYGLGKIGPTTFSLGLEGGYARINYYHYWNSGFPRYRYAFNSFYLGIRPAIHYNFNVTHLDVYGGISLGPRFVSYAYYYDGTGPEPPEYRSPVYDPAYFAGGVFLGVSYYMKPGLGVFAEFSSVFSNAAVGVSFRF